MRNAKHFLVCCALGALAGCGDYAGGEQVTASREQESSEQPNFGSATDIVSADGTQVSTNNQNLADHPVGGSAPMETGYRSQPRPGQASDEELRKQIKVALTTGSLGTTGVIAEDQLTKIQVQVQDGVVTLSGPVSSEQEKQSIEDQIDGMKGVKSVRNQLTVGAGTEQHNSIDASVPRTPGNE